MIQCYLLLSEASKLKCSGLIIKPVLFFLPYMCLTMIPVQSFFKGKGFLNELLNQPTLKLTGYRHCAKNCDIRSLPVSAWDFHHTGGFSGRNEVGLWSLHLWHILVLIFEICLDCLDPFSSSLIRKTQMEIWDVWTGEDGIVAPTRRNSYRFCRSSVLSTFFIGKRIWLASGRKIQKLSTGECEVGIFCMALLA